MSTARITNLGAIVADSITHSGTGNTTITIPEVSTADTFATLAAEQTLTNKTLTAPVIDSITTEDGGSISLPTVASGSIATLATTSDITSAVSNIDTSALADAGRVSYESGRIDRLLAYLENWISVGNLTMTGISDTVNYNDKEFVCKITIKNGVISLNIKNIPSGVTITSITARKTENGGDETINFTTVDNNIILEDSYDSISTYVSSNIQINCSNNKYISILKSSILTNGFVFMDNLQINDAGFE